jgi:RHS repeat-associated protein
LENQTYISSVAIPQGTITQIPVNTTTTSGKTVTDYVGNMIYQNGTLKEILTPEGYIEKGVYYYYLQDHQGNNRVMINSSGAVQEYSNYYPDGMRYIPESSTNAAAIPYRYNNKEFEAMNGLNQCDYGARRKLSWSGIWGTIDPKAEEKPWISPYAYCSDNPMNRIDPDGRSDFEDQNGKFTKHVEDGSNAVYQQTGSGTGLHYAFEYYDSSSGGDNSPNIKSAIQEQQNLNDGNSALQEKVDADGNSTTFCNFATQNVMTTVESAIGANISIVVKGKANQMADDIAQNPNYTPVSEAEAEKNAQNGGLSIVTYENPNPKHSGHIATYSVGDNLDKGKIANIGPADFTGFVSLNRAISPKKPKNYYILNLLSTATVVAPKK